MSCKATLFIKTQANVKTFYTIIAKFYNIFFLDLLFNLCVDVYVDLLIQITYVYGFTCLTDV